MRKLLAALSIAACGGIALAAPASADQYRSPGYPPSPYQTEYNAPGYTPDYSTHDGYRTEGYPPSAYGGEAPYTYGQPHGYNPSYNTAPYAPQTGDPTYAPYRDADGTCYFYNLTGKLCRE